MQYMYTLTIFINQVYTHFSTLAIKPFNSDAKVAIVIAILYMTQSSFKCLDTHKTHPILKPKPSTLSFVSYAGCIKFLLLLRICTLIYTYTHTHTHTYPYMHMKVISHAVIYVVLALKVG